jgi:hypothetical protein
MEDAKRGSMVASELIFLIRCVAGFVEVPSRICIFVSVIYQGGKFSIFVRMKSPITGFVGDVEEITFGGKFGLLWG